MLANRPWSATITHAHTNSFIAQFSIIASIIDHRLKFFWNDFEPEAYFCSLSSLRAIQVVCSLGKVKKSPCTVVGHSM